MYKVIFIFSLLFLFLSPSYSETLPKCPGENRVITTWINCNGSYTAIDGHKYSGDFDGKGLYSGYGVLKNKDSVYEGEFFKDKYHGKGKQILTNTGSGTATYEGEFFMGNWNGQGKLWSEDGSFKYEGGFQNMEMTGYGTLTYNGESVTGNWKNASCSDKATCDAVEAIKQKYQ